MKKVLSIVVLALVCVFAFTSCNKEKTMEELLTIEKGWTLSAATSTPAYVMNSGAQISNLFEGYFLDCEKDDIIKFKSDGYQYVNPGKEICEEGTGGDTHAKEWSPGKWSLNESAKTLVMHLQYFDDSQKNATIVSLTEKELKVNVTINITPNEVTKAEGTYTWTLTYVPAK